MTDDANKGAESKKASAASRRSAARLAAVQALYQIEITGHDVETVTSEFLNQRLGEEVDGVSLAQADRQLFGQVVKGAAAEDLQLDDMLAAVLDDSWPIERLESLLKVILRAGAFELSECLDVPARVIITEYVDLAYAFFNGKEPGMVNGVLDKLAHALRIEEFETNGSAQQSTT